MLKWAGAGGGGGLSPWISWFQKRKGNGPHEIHDSSPKRSAVGKDLLSLSGVTEQAAAGSDTKEAAMFQLP